MNRSGTPDVRTGAAHSSPLNDLDLAGSEDAVWASLRDLFVRLLMPTNDDTIRTLALVADVDLSLTPRELRLIVAEVAAARALAALKAALAETRERGRDVPVIRR